MENETSKQLIATKIYNTQRTYQYLNNLLQENSNPCCLLRCNHSTASIMTMNKFVGQSEGLLKNR